MCLCALVTRVVQAFDPAKAKRFDLSEYLAAMMTVPAFQSALRGGLFMRMAAELPKYQ